MTAPVPPPPAFGRFFLPGPTDVHPEVLAAMQRPMIGHRSGAMEQLLAGIEAPLARLFRTARPVLVGTTSATGFMEMAVRNGVRHRALSLVNGSFSERFAKLVSACGKECVRLDVPLGCAVEPDMLRDTLRRTSVDAVTLGHAGAATGVLQDVEAGGAEGRGRRHDAMRRRVQEWSEQHGIAYLPREERRSWTVSCLKVPEGKSAKQIVGALKQTGWTIGSGYGSLKESTIRIGHMGDHTVGALDQLLDLLAGLVA